ncbi:MAG: mechanosensitive ion channel family protein [Parachlamydiales bacterium]|nr:mechanosensitive ion channel family protein [Parachlamydiales bacterium]
MLLAKWDIDPYLYDNSLITLIFGGLIFLVRWFVVRMLRSPSRQWTSEQRLRWLNYTRSIFVVILVFGVIYIWAEQFHNLALSIIAIALAVVMATKELFLCFNGSLMRLRSNAFTIGDRIEFNGVRGDVIDTNILTTTIMEVGPKLTSQQATTRTITFPNSLFLMYPVVNESFVENFLSHTICIPLDIRDNWKKAQEVLMRLAAQECSIFMKDAKRQMREMEHHIGLPLPAVEPHVWIHIPYKDELHLMLRIITPNHLRGNVEQRILSKFLEEFRPNPLT